MTVNEYIQNNFKLEPTVGDISHNDKSFRQAYLESSDKLNAIASALTRVGDAIQNAPEIINPTLSSAITELSEAIVTYNNSFVQLQPYLTARIKDLVSKS